MSDDAAAARPLGRELALRLAATGAVAMAVLAVVLAVVYAAQLDRAAQQALADAQRHYGARVAQIDAEWLRQADLLRAQIEHSGALDPADEALALARLTALFASMGGQGVFTHGVVLDAAGRAWFRYGTRTRSVLPLPPPGLIGWVYSDDDRLTYRALRQPLQQGPRGRGEIVLYAPVDNALLIASAYPGTTISLHWGERTDLAMSDTDHARGESPTGGRVLTAEVPWGEGPHTPTLDIERTVVPALQPGEMALIVAVGGVAGVVLGWLMIGNWARGHVRHIATMSQATERFAADHDAASALFARLDGAMRGASREVRALSDGLEALMAGVAGAEAEQRQAHARLRELNATLEQRVEARTRELEAARDQALAGARAREQFLAAMSHELRTPLTGLLGALEVVDAAALPPEQRQFIDVARRTGDALRLVIDDVLDHAKLEAGQVALRDEVFSAADVVRESVSLFAAVAMRRELSLAAHCGDGSEPPVRGDPARLRQVLLNLIGNAIKFTDRGRIDVRVDLVGGAATHARLRFAIADTGIGIDPALRATLFQPFVQAPTTQAQARGGTGLGLAISQRLVQAMGGRIEVDSTPDEGSTFYFELDLPRAAVAPVPLSPSAAGTAGPAAALAGRVLLVEDNAVNRIVARAMLERLGLDVAEAGDGVQAIEALRGGGFDVVLMDCQMPVLDGIEAARRIRTGDAGAAGRTVPIIAVTANALGGDAQHCLAAGMNAHLTKPYREAELVDVLTPWLRAKAGAAPAGEAPRR